MATPTNIFTRVQSSDPAVGDIYDKLAHILQALQTVTPAPTPTPTPTPVTPVTPGGGGSGGGGSATSYAFTDVPLLAAVPSNNPTTGAPYAVDGMLVDVGGVLYRYAGGPTYQWQDIGVAEAAIANAEWLTSVAGTNTITATTVTTYTALAVGFVVRLVPANTNTGPVTLNVNAIGASAVTKNGTTALNAAGGELLAGKAYLLLWDGTRWQIIGAIGPRSATVLASDVNGVPTAAPLADTNIWIGSGGNLPVAKAVSGDATLADTGALTLATVNTASPGTFGSTTRSAVVTVNGKGLVTASSDVAIAATGGPPTGAAGGDLSGTYPNPAVAQASGDFPVAGNIEAITVGKGLQIKAGTNARVGTGTLSGGTLLVGNTSVTANTLIFLSDQGGGVTANIGSLYVSARVNGTSFTVSSVNPLDSSNFAYLLVESI